jgi:hypothetical protein
MKGAKKRGYYSSELVAIYIATEMLRHVNSKPPGRFQQVLAQHLKKIHGWRFQDIEKVLSKMRLSASMKITNLLEQEKVDALIQKG